MPKSSKQKNEKYLKQDAAGVWHLDFRVPKRFGGKLVRNSLFTEDKEVATSIRDQYVTPVLAASSAISALEAIGRSILTAQGDAVSHLSSLKQIITASSGITLPEAYSKYEYFLKNHSGLRPRSQVRYAAYTKTAIDIIGPSKAAGLLSKEDAVRLRDALKKQAKSATTIDNVFSIFRGFLRWLNREGLICSTYVVENFLIDLPPVHKENHCIVPPSLADNCMMCVPDWTMAPRIARYTGMRRGEIDACCSEFKGCGIVFVEGHQCFCISKDFCKTYSDRYVPVCDKLAPYMDEKNIGEVRRHARLDGNETPRQKKYNRVVKAIEGCSRVVFHSWRTYAQTMMIEAGIDDLIVRRIIGHKDSSNVHYGYTAGRIEAMKRALNTIP